MDEQKSVMEAPQYKCHKVVRAAKIVDFEYQKRFSSGEYDIQGDVLLHFDGGVPSLVVSGREVRGLDVGGYLVQYIDGYRSYSPSKVFEDGYLPVLEQPLSADRMLQWFEYKHLPPHLQAVSAPFGELAHRIVTILPSNPERTVALRKLLEAKDCAVRALLEKPR